MRRQPGDHVAITVRDRGVGIPAGRAGENIRSVLHHETGRQGHRPRAVPGPRLRASGRWHGQRSRANSGEGTSVTICLPRGETAASTPAHRSPGRSAGTGNVLLIEDNPDVANASAGFLEQLGYSVRWVSDAEGRAERDRARQASI